MNDMTLAPASTLADEKNQADENDAAWASINTPLHIDAMLVFIQDVERLIRINPMLEFKKWENLGASQYYMAGRNTSQETPFEFDTGITVRRISNGIELEYDRGIKASTLIEVEAIVCDNNKPGSKLTITDYYDRLSEDDRKEHLDEVDKSLVIWARDLQKYLINWHRWSKFKTWRWYMNRIWLPMKPTARRITYMMLWISVVEVALIALGAGIYFVEYY